MTLPMRVMCFAGYTHPAQHRKIELLADLPNVELLHIADQDNGKPAGVHPSANGQRHYTLRIVQTRSLGRRGDPHRTFWWPPIYDIRSFKPHLIHYEGETESVGAAEIVLFRWLLAPKSALVLTTWQNILRPRNLGVRLINQLNLRAAQHILCANSDGITVLRRQNYRGPCSVLPIVGVDTRYFYPRSVDVREKLGLEGCVVGYIGRLVPEKGVVDLMRAVAQTHIPLQVLIVGDGPALPHLQSLAHQLNLADRCKFVSAMPYERVAEYMNALDLLVLPSRTTTHWKEQFGRVLIEAMACKVAVIGSDSGAIPEVVGEAGRIFPEGNVEALASLLTEMASNEGLRRNLAEQGYVRALCNYAVERIAQQTWSVWQSMVH